jgi:uncharacterized membrane protein
MANYIIIGGDNKEYGPVNEADVRQWIAEGRLNAASRIKAESDAEFRALSQFPEFAAALQTQAAPATIPAPGAAQDYLERDYELDIGGCISRGWDLYKANFGLLFGAFLIMFLMQMACGGALSLVRLPLNPVLLRAPVGVRVGFDYVSSGLFSLVMGPLMGGLFLVYLKVIRGQAPGVGEVFAGFQRAYLPLFLGSLVVSLVVTGCMLPFQFVWQMKAGPLLEQMQHLQNDPTGVQKLVPQLFAALGGSVPVLLICLVPVTFISVCWQFTLPLIIDKQMAFAEAMKTSWRMVMKHWWQVFGLAVLAGLVSLLGIFGCCIGVVFTAPIGLAALMFAYETIFGAQKN